MTVPVWMVFLVSIENQVALFLVHPVQIFTLKMTRKLKHKKMQMPGFILERVRRKRGSDPDSIDAFQLHIVCFNCWIAKVSKVDVWKPGRGFFLQPKDYFSK